MNIRKELAAAALMAALVAGTAGCELAHELQPHRMWKMNHGTSGMPADDWSYYPVNLQGSPTYFASVPDDTLPSPQRLATRDVRR